MARGPCENHCGATAKSVFRVTDPQDGLDMEQEACTRGCVRELWFGTPRHPLPKDAKVEHVRSIPVR